MAERLVTILIGAALFVGRGADAVAGLQWDKHKPLVHLMLNIFPVLAIQQVSKATQDNQE